MIRKTVRSFAWALLFAAACGWGQTHKVARPETVVRAVGVYEWTGDLAKPTGSRLVPVTVFIDGALQDGGVYLARPVPLALLSGNYYELESAGVPKGGLELSYARHLQAVEAATGASLFDDGWFGYGVFRAPAGSTGKGAALRKSTQLSEVKRSGAKDGKDDGRPHFSNRSDGAAKDSAQAGPAPTDRDKADADAKDAATKDADKTDAPVGAATPADADRPTLRRRSGSGSDSSTKGSTASSTGPDTSTPADDPDRPRLTKKKDDSAENVPGDPVGSVPASSGGSQSGGGTTTAGADTPQAGAQGGSKDDPDRPTLKRRSAEEIKRDRKREDSASVSAVGSLNDDPNRPKIRRGKPASAMTEEDLPKLSGLPVDLKQMVAVSDAVNRPEHDFARPWEDDAERKAILTRMQALARARLAAYGAKAAPAPLADVAPAAKAKTPTPPASPAARRAAAKKKASAPVEVALLDEDLKGYTLSYGGLATYVYTAHTAGVGAALDYVTVVAQADAMGELKVAIDNVTDAAHLDRTPRMRLVDAVDAEASNRASLLFELRGQRTRQFGLYSVIGARADQRFVSGTTQ